MLDWILSINWVGVASVVGPFLIALTTFLKNANKNQKATQESIAALKAVVEKNNAETNKKVDALSDQFVVHLKEEEEEKAKQARMRILRFYDELCEGNDHSESYFEDILDDCKFYEDYCREHKEFQNHRGAAAIDFIDQTYRRLKQNGGFLKHN